MSKSIVCLFNKHSFNLTPLGLCKGTLLTFDGATHKYLGISTV